MDGWVGYCVYSPKKEKSYRSALLCRMHKEVSMYDVFLLLLLLSFPVFRKSPFQRAFPLPSPGVGWFGSQA